MTRKRILVVDDEELITRNIKLGLEKTDGFIVRTENQSRNALAAARDFRPDAIVLDIVMPEKDGGEVAFELQEDKLLKNVPIIYLTAIVTKREAHGESSTSPAGHFLAKPVDLQELVDAIQGAVK